MPIASIDPQYMAIEHNCSAAESGLSLYPSLPLSFYPSLPPPLTLLPSLLSSLPHSILPSLSLSHSPLQYYTTRRRLNDAFNDYLDNRDDINDVEETVSWLPLKSDHSWYSHLPSQLDCCGIEEGRGDYERLNLTQFNENCDEIEDDRRGDPTFVLPQVDWGVQQLELYFNCSPSPSPPSLPPSPLPRPSSLPLPLPLLPLSSLTPPSPLSLPVSPSPLLSSLHLSLLPQGCLIYLANEIQQDLYYIGGLGMGFATTELAGLLIAMQNFEGL